MSAGKSGGDSSGELWRVILANPTTVDSFQSLDKWYMDWQDERQGASVD